jgi:hypothetical protein
MYGTYESFPFLSREVSPHERKSKPPGEIALDRMVVRTVGELARIGDADLGLRGELQIAAASTSAASRAIGTRKILNPAPMLHEGPEPTAEYAQGRL